MLKLNNGHLNVILATFIRSQIILKKMIILHNNRSAELAERCTIISLKKMIIIIIMNKTFLVRSIIIFSLPLCKNSDTWFQRLTRFVSQ